MASVKAELADAVHALKKGSRDATQTKALVYALSILADVIKGADLEATLRRIEERDGHGRGDAGAGAEGVSAPGQH
jgi:hypothetical protein